ncbi:alpha/beta hydrolase [Paenibacillus peoriae]|uniref:Alpha/beta hydrolase n=1 Tax=Paenibacillus peoriae TaxID=59893 RepID=A0A7H0YCG4_9BACL|nr:alpha/beta fold hydrolase [Paenibacillus peoriae]QNR68772.1 alpha/beta hydrolase [Paenibacillus peoriae]
MREYTFTIAENDGTELFAYRWLPDQNLPIKGIVQISHGMCETSYRYIRLAEKLTACGYGVYANDHIGHGRTAGDPDKLGMPGANAFNRMANGMLELGEIAAKEFPDQSRFLLGHSMGSFLTQKIMYDDRQAYHGFILSGTNGRRGLLKLGEQVALLQAKLQGMDHRSMLLNAMVFGGFNRAFRPVRTAFDWLSRDPEEVDQFLHDPLCGAICTTGFFLDFFRLLQEIHWPSSLKHINPKLPVYIFAGDRDPVGLFGKGVLSLVEMYRSLELQDIEYRLYPDGRHEMLHETNREEVMSDIVDWLDRHVNTEVTSVSALSGDSEAPGQSTSPKSSAL